MFSRQKQYLMITRSLLTLFFQSNIKYISYHHRVISSIYPTALFYCTSTLLQGIVLKYSNSCTARFHINHILSFFPLFFWIKKKTNKQTRIRMQLTDVTVVSWVRRVTFTFIVIHQICAISIWHTRIGSAVINVLFTYATCKTSSAQAIESACKIISCACTSMMTWQWHADVC